MPEEEQHAFEIRDARHALIVDERFRWSDPQAPGRERTGRIRGVLAVSATDHAVVDLSVKRAFIIAAGHGLLPAWAGFLEGVLECDVLTPNAARDGVREDAALLAARCTLAELVAREILAAAARPENERLLQPSRPISRTARASCTTSPRPSRPDRTCCWPRRAGCGSSTAQGSR